MVGRLRQAVIDRYGLPPDWKPDPGFAVSDKGYVKVAKWNHPDRGKYEHRLRMDEAIREWNPFGWTEIPPDYHVHHIDFCTVHNCRGNLLLLDRVIHDATSRSAILRCPYTGRFLTRGEWERRFGEDNRVPF